MMRATTIGASLLAATALTPVMAVAQTHAVRSADIATALGYIPPKLGVLTGQARDAAAGILAEQNAQQTANAAIPSASRRVPSGDAGGPLGALVIDPTGGATPNTLGLNGNLSGAIPSGTYGGLGWNYTAGYGEIDLFNKNQQPPASGYGGVQFLQKTGPSTWALLGRLDSQGDLTLGGRSILDTVSPNLLDLFTSPPANGVYSGAGSSIAYFPIVGGNPFANTVASQVIDFTTTKDAGFFESGWVVNSHITTGSAPQWLAGVATTAGQSVLGASGNVYTAQNSGTTGSTEPSCGSGTCSDGTVTWLFRQVNAYYGKAAQATYTVVSPGASQAVWDRYQNFELGIGTAFNFVAGYEMDVLNQGTDCAVGVRTCHGILIGLAGGPGLYPITAAISIGGSGSAAGAHFGVLLDGVVTADNVGFDDDTNAQYGFATGYLNLSSHSIASYLDKATAPISYDDLGVHTTGINLGGTYSGNQIIGTGFHVTPTGGLYSATATITGGASAASLGFDQALSGVAPIGAYGGIGWNYTGGYAEVAFFNKFLQAPTYPYAGFQFYQLTAASTYTEIGRLDGAGNLTITGLYEANGVPGVSCSGTPTSSFATIKGIITHC